MKLKNIKRSVFRRTMLFTLIISVSGTVMAGDNFSSKLINQSKQNNSDGFYLVRDTIIGENDCVKVEGNKKLNPGESVQLNIKQGCKWGVAKYKIFSVKDNKSMGYLAHSFHDGKFSIDITTTCNGTECHFYDINPLQNKGK